MAYVPSHTCFEMPSRPCEACVRGELIQAGKTGLIERIERKVPEPHRYTYEELRQRFADRFEAPAEPVNIRPDVVGIACETTCRVLIFLALAWWTIQQNWPSR